MVLGKNTPQKTRNTAWQEKNKKTEFVLKPHLNFKEL